MRASKAQSRVDYYIERAKHWSDVALWLRGGCQKPLIEIREERILREAE